MRSIRFICIAALVFAGLTFCFAGCGVNADNQEHGLVKESTASKGQPQRTQELPGDLTARFVAEPTQPPELYSRGSYIDEQHAWVAAGSDVKRTLDGGRTWQLLRPAAESEPVFGKMGDIYHLPSFITTTRGWLPAFGTWQTEDGGSTWRQIFSDHTGNPHFSDQQHGWIAIYTEKHLQSYVTKDGGQTWHPCGPKRRLNQQTPGQAFFLSPQRGWAITSYTDDERRTVYGLAHTTDGGCSWRQLWTEVQDQTYCEIYFLNEKEGWLAGCYSTGNLIQTKDGGKTWRRVPTPIETWRSAPVDVYFVDSKKGWIITRATESGNQEGMYRTTDGGRTWQQLTKDDITKGVGTNGGENEVPNEWKAGRLFQMLYVSRLTK